MLAQLAAPFERCEVQFPDPATYDLGRVHGTHVATVAARSACMQHARQGKNKYCSKGGNLTPAASIDVDMYSATVPLMIVLCVCMFEYGE